MITLELAVPAHDEAATIVDALQRLSSVLGRLSDVDWTITVAENGSADGTAQAVERAALPRVRVLVVAGKGKGLAIRSAARASHADIFGFVDADLSVDPAMIPTFVQSVRDGMPVVVGSRLLDPKMVERGWWRSILSRLFNWFSRRLVPTGVRDNQCGMKFMDRRGRDVLVRCQEDGWFLDVEFLARCRQEKLPVKEIPVPWEEFRYPGRKSKLRVFRDGIRSVAALTRIRRRLSASV